MRNTILKGASLLLAVCATQFVLPSAAQADGGGSNGWTRLEIKGKGTYVRQVQVHTNRWSEVLSFYGHFRVWGPGIDFRTEDRHNRWTLVHYRNINRHLPNGSKICAEAFSKNKDGTYRKRGLPCVEITA